MRAMWGTVVSMLIVGPSSAHADSVTTTCRLDFWDRVVCDSSYWSSDSGGGGPAKPTDALMMVNGLALLSGGIMLAAGVDPELSMGVLLGGEMGPAPVGAFFLDQEAPEDVTAAWKRSLSLQLEAGGGVMGDGNDRMTPFVGGRLTAGRGRIGVDAAGERAIDDPEHHSSIEGHLLLRAGPRQHLAGLALGIGARRISLQRSIGTTRVFSGVDVTLPHEYVLFRDDKTGAADVVVSVRPHVLVDPENGVDGRFDLGLVVPVASRLAVEVVGTSYSFDDDIHYGLSLALATGL